MKICSFFYTSDKNGTRYVAGMDEIIRVWEHGGRMYVELDYGDTGVVDERDCENVYEFMYPNQSTKREISTAEYLRRISWKNDPEYVKGLERLKSTWPRYSGTEQASTPLPEPPADNPDPHHPVFMDDLNEA